MQNKTNKIIAILLVFMILYSTVGTVVSMAMQSWPTEGELENQDPATSNKNVEVDISYEDGTHKKTIDLGSTDTKIKLKVNVKNTGYLENMTVDFRDANFKISGDATQAGVQEIDEESNQVVLGKIVAGKACTVELSIAPVKDDEVVSTTFKRDNAIFVSGTYVDANAEEKQVTKTNRLHTAWEQNVESTLDMEITKYVPYNIESKKGILVETTIKTNVKDSALPIKSTHIEYSVPKLGDTLPEKTIVVAKQTVATNGDTNGENFYSDNWQYDSKTGKVTIEVNNKEKNGMIQWKKDAMDEYKVISTYSADVYDSVKDQGSDVTISSMVKHSVYSNNAEQSCSLTKNATLGLRNQIGNIYGIEASIVEGSINKGYIYNKTNETTYTEEYNLYVTDAELVKELDVIQDADKFATNSTIVATDSNAYNKTIKVNANQMKKMLGDAGYIEIYSGDTKVGTLQQDGKETITYDLSSLDINKMTLKTSEPATEGYLKIEVEKAIKKDTAYTNSQIKNFNELSTNVSMKAINGQTTLEADKVDGTAKLVEPTAKINVAMDNKTLSTIVPNSNVEIRATLETDSADDILYSNPTIKITLPDCIEEVSNAQYNLIQSEELKIASSRIIEENGSKVAEIKLNGTQTKYNDSVTKGATIIFNADMTTSKLITSRDDVIRVESKNENTLQELIEGTNTKSQDIPVSFVAPAGVVTVSSLTGYSGSETITTIEEKEQTAKIDIYSAEKNITYKGTIINNYSNNISGMKVLGRIPATAKDETFDIKLNSAITVSNENAKVYYSTKVNATNDLTDTTNGWAESIQDYSSVKSYLIVLDKMEAGTQTEFTISAKVPANLTYNNQNKLSYKVNYNNESSVGTMAEEKQSTQITLTTGTGPVIEGTLTADVENGSTVREYQYIRFDLNVKNTGTVDAKNVQATVTAPGGLEIVDYNPTYQDYANERKSITFTIGDLKAGTTTNNTYYVQVKLSSDSVTEETVSNIATITADTLTQLESNKVDLTVKTGDLRVLNNTVEMPDVIKKGTKVKYSVSAKNISKQELKNVVIEVPLPENTQKDGITVYSDNYTIENNKIILNLGNIAVGEFEYRDLIYTLNENVTGEISTRISARADGVDTHYSNERKLKISEPNLTVTSIDQDSKYIKEGKEFTYTYVLKSEGIGNIGRVNVTDTLPEELEYVGTKINIKTSEEDTPTSSISSNDNTINMTIDSVRPGTTITIEITAIPHLKSKADDEKEISNYITVNYNDKEIKSTPIVNYIEYVNSEHNGSSTDPDNPNNPDNPDNPTEDGKYKITGVAWLDNNKDGKRSDDEPLLKDVQVILMNKLDGTVVVDKNTNQEKITVTDEQGKYSFNNVEQGTYIVVFLYDSEKYILTDYRKNGVANSVNSDVVSTDIVYDGENRKAAITDTIIVTDSNIRDIDIGLCNPQTFDLSLEKYVSKITVSTSSKTAQSYDYENKKIAKIEVPAKDVDNTSIVIEYKIVVKNNGDVSGYARKVVDYLPEDLKFSSEINKDWYQSTNGNIYNNSLANQEIKPGESKEITLTLTKKLNSDAMGKVISNDAEIYEAYNDFGLEDVNSTPANQNREENDLSTANTVLSVKTGQIIMNIAIVVAVIAIIGIGIYEINTKVLKKEM